MRTARSSSHQPGDGGVCLSACWDTPPGVNLETPPWPDPSSSPLGVGLETCKACWDTPPPGDLQGMLGYHPPPVNRITDTCKNITFPQLRLRAVISSINSLYAFIYTVVNSLWKQLNSCSTAVGSLYSRQFSTPHFRFRSSFEGHCFPPFLDFRTTVLRLYWKACLPHVWEQTDHSVHWVISQFYTVLSLSLMISVLLRSSDCWFTLWFWPRGIIP